MNERESPLSERDDERVKEAWVADRKRNHQCWCDTCYAAHVRDKIGMQPIRFGEVGW